MLDDEVQLHLKVLVIGMRVDVLVRWGFVAAATNARSGAAANASGDAGVWWILSTHRFRCGYKGNTF